MSKMSKAITFFKALKLATRIELDDDHWEYTEEPHVSRRQAILQKHPEIKKLMGYDPIIAVIVACEVIIQIILAYLISLYNPDWIVLILMSYFVGAFLNHSLGSAIHEIGHNLAFGHKYGWANRALSVFANLPMTIPMAISYRRYHSDHHRWLGHDTMDVDIPTRIETYLFRRPITKLIWLFLHPLIHGVRPFCKSPKPVSVWEIGNFTAQILFDVVIYYFFGVKALTYLFMGTFFGMGAHPLAGHFISEHYLFANNQATHSYYGPLNPILFNVGYHIEHHDFPYIPCTRIAKVKELAPEFYDHLPHHTSWVAVVWNFIWQDNMGPHARSVTLQNKSNESLYKGMGIEFSKENNEDKKCT